jgi:hypothetical protein
MLNKTASKPKPTGRKLVATWLPPEEAEAFAKAAAPRGGVSKVLQAFVRRFVRSRQRAA